MEYILTNFILYARRNFENVNTIGNAITFCTDILFAVHFNCTEKKSYIYVKNLTHDNCADFILLPYCLKHISYFHNILWLGTDAATSFLPLYLLLSPSRNYLFCNHRPPRKGGGGDLCSFIASLYSRI